MAKSKLLLVFSKLVIFFTFAIVSISNATAEVNIDKTRLIINANDRFAELSLVNSAEYPTAIQLWTDAGNILAYPSEELTPVFVLPPIFKLEPGEIRQIKVMLNRSDLKDVTSESLFWLNILQVPQDINPQGMDNEDNVAKVTLPLRYRLKILVRPNGVQKPSDTDYQDINFKIVGNQLHISNQTHWHMNFLSIQIGDEVIERVTTLPLSVQVKPLNMMNLNTNHIRYTIISDEGQLIEFTKNIQ
ncbi:fimbria/pilus periplasmic chaperone [Vibrio sp. MA40-2]|uniref:fimbria/pilus periplasmic chaperone n=1 Tax=Vibrio sp. MA40-2 TaxID=3391828 RepID=UPI0039A46C7C